MNTQLQEILRPPSKALQLESWARRCGVADLLESHVSMLCPFVEISGIRSLISMAPKKATLFEVVLRDRMDLTYLGRGARRPMFVATTQYLQFHARLQYEARRRMELWSRSLTPPVISRLSSRLQRLHGELIADPRAAAPVLHSEAESFVDEVELIAGHRFLTHREYGLDEETEVRFSLEFEDGDRPQWECDCLSHPEPCSHLRVSVGWFLDYLCGDGEAVRETLAEVLETPPWRRFLRDVERSLPAAEALATAVRDERLTWRLGLDRPGILTAGLYVQTLGRSGKWSRGRKVRYRELHMGHPTIAEEDRRPLAVALLEGIDGTGYLHTGDLAEALIGHPRVFSLADPKTRLELRAAPLRVVLADNGSDDLRFGIEIGGVLPSAEALLVTPDRRHLIVAEPFGEGVWYVVRVPAELRGAAATVARKNGRNIPRDDVGAAVAVLGRIAEHAEIAIHEGVSGDVEALSTHLGVKIRSFGAGLEFECVLLAPPGCGPDLIPGEGSRELIRVSEGGLRRLRRDLAAELQAADRIGNVLLAAGALSCGIYRYEAAATENALEVLLALGDLGDELELRWAEDAESLRVTRATSAALRVHVARRGSLFEIGGEVEVDGTSLSVSSLLAAVRKGESFVRVGPGRFARIERELRERLQTVDRVAAGDGRGGLAAGAVAISRLEATLGEHVAIGGDAGYHELLARVAAAGDFEARLPEGLSAKLRPYQVEGYYWLARLARMQTGAILADDMGLGKTVQTLALLLHRAENGPALVLAPTSVCAEWRDQAARFAPELEVTLYRGGDRRAALERLGPGSVLVASYGVLRRDVEVLREYRFATMILDEAQAIKNATTRGSKAARAIDAELAIALTGTPLENHLGELWAIFRVVSPGLLGSWEHFRRRFALPIERDGDQRALKDLAALVRPLLLRRTKAQVAPELPSRTEIVRRVVFSRPERALYEAARGEILARLASGKGLDDERFAILAAITRLRQLACHPRLVDTSSTLGSAKLMAAGELIGELVEEGQRALVFSQFTRHLALLRELLDTRGIPYFYLDGSTPPERRDRLVVSWREGSMPLFLVSLKAGGTGLNLTGADCVLHLDPWWNPAVEDQATDRTHRIGQKRPVTVIRLITEGTIEEAVLELHESKRELARGVLEGADAAGALGTKELVDLIRVAGKQSRRVPKLGRHENTNESGALHHEDACPVESRDRSTFRA